MKPACLATLAVLVFTFAQPATAVEPEDMPRPQRVPGEWIVKYRDGVHPETLRQHADAHRIELITRAGSPIGRIGRMRMREPQAIDDAQVSLELQASGLVEYAEPNYLRRRHESRVPDDPRFDEQWALDNPAGPDLDLLRAWGLQTGSADVVLAVLDESFAVEHPDLAANMGPGRCFSDCDGDVTDVRQRDDTDTHGTQVVGAAAAVGNNGTGISGTAWTVTVMPLRADLSVSSIVAAIDHAIEHDADILLGSFGSAGFSQAEFDALERANEAGIPFITSAGNSDSDNDKGGLSYPQSYDLPNIIAVAASDREDRLASWSQYGQTRVALAAPGIGILTTATSGSGEPIHRYHSGTSYSAPLTAGIAALLHAQYPGIGLQELIARLVAGADMPGALRGRVLGGRANAWRSLQPDLLDDPVIVVDAVHVDDTTPSGNANGLLDAGEEALLQVQLESLWGEAAHLGGVLTLVEPGHDGSLEILDDRALATEAGEPLAFPVRITAGLSGNHRLLFRLELELPDGRTQTRWFRHELGLLAANTSLDQAIGRDAQDEFHAWHVEVPDGASDLRLQTETADGIDIDLLARHGAPPEYLISLDEGGDSEDAFYRVGDDVHSSGRQDGNERLDFADPEPGTWHMVVVNYAQRSHDYRVSASWCTASGCPGRLRFARAEYSAAAGQDAVTVAVVREAGTTGPASVAYTSAGGSAVPGTDYEAVAGTLEWADGESGTRTFRVPLVDDRPETVRDIHLRLDHATGATLAPPSLRAEIRLEPPVSEPVDDNASRGGGGLLGPLWLACMLGLLLYRRRRAGTIAT